MDVSPEIIVDARGHRCPVPTLRLRRAAEAAPAGSDLTLIADDPLVRIDAPHFAQEAGFQVVSIKEENGALIVKVRKPG